MLQVSRDGSLKIPKKLEAAKEIVNSNEDRVGVMQAFSVAENGRFNAERVMEMTKSTGEKGVVL